MRYLLIIICLGLCSSFATAEDEYITAMIENIGCHKNDNTCFISISSSVGPATCHSSSIRWESEKDAAGNSALSMFTAAFFAGKRVRLKISNQCYAYQTGFPTFDWFVIYQ